MLVNLEISSGATGLEDISVHSNRKERQSQGTFKFLNNCTYFILLQSNAQNSPSSMWTENSQLFKLDLEKAEEPEIKLPTSAGSYKKEENSRKTSTSVSLTTLKSLTVWITAYNLWIMFHGKKERRKEGKERKKKHTVVSDSLQSHGL